jgi:hypothetical protein
VGKRVANDSATSCVLSPISAMNTRIKAVRNECPEKENMPPDYFPFQRGPPLRQSVNTPR